MLQGDFQDNYRNFCTVMIDYIRIVSLDNIKESFSLKRFLRKQLYAILSQHYRRIVVLDPRYFYGNIEDNTDSNGISDMLFLYNANTFFRDNSPEMMLH